MTLSLPYSEWLSEVRRLLAVGPRPEVEEGVWSDANIQRYYDEGFSPASAGAELRFRELARS